MLSWKSCSDDPMNTRIVHLLAGMSFTETSIWPKSSAIWCRWTCC